MGWRYKTDSTPPPLRVRIGCDSQDMFRYKCFVINVHVHIRFYLTSEEGASVTDAFEFQGLTHRDPILQAWPGQRLRRLAPSPKRRVCSDATHSASSLLDPAWRQLRVTKKHLHPQQRRQNPPHLRVRESPVCGTRETSNLTPQPGSVPTTTLTPTATRRAVSVCR